MGKKSLYKFLKRGREKIKKEKRKIINDKYNDKNSKNFYDFYIFFNTFMFRPVRWFI